MLSTSIIMDTAGICKWFLIIHGEKYQDKISELKSRIIGE